MNRASRLSVLIFCVSSVSVLSAGLSYADSITPVGVPMTTSRSKHTATALYDGRVFLAGGASDSSAELFTFGAPPTYGSFTPTGNLATGRSQHMATLLPGGRVLITGGTDGSGNVLSSAEIYDPASGTFFNAGNMTTGRRNHCATLLPNGRVLITGGIDASGTVLSTTELYDLRTGSFTPAALMNHPRAYHTASLLNNGHVLLTGGANLSIHDYGSFNGGCCWQGTWTEGEPSTELYDPATGLFTPTGSLQTGRWEHTATLLRDGRVLLVGGWQSFEIHFTGWYGTPEGQYIQPATAELYDPATGTSTYTGALATARAGHTSTLLSNGQVLVAGGYRGEGWGWPGGYDFANGRFWTFGNTEIYDPVAGTFTAGPDMETARFYHTATLLTDGGVLLAGGGNSSAEIYQPSLAPPPSATQLGSMGTTTNPSGTYAEPVNTATGDYFMSHMDLSVPGRGMSLTFSRAYNSLDPYSGPFGPGWTHSFNIALSRDSNTGIVTIKEADGHEDYFAPLGGGSYAPQTVGLFDALAQNPDSTFTLTRKTRTTLNFSAAGKLLSIVDRNGNAQTLSYAGNNLTSITDSAGRKYTFSYGTNNHIASLTDPAGRVVRYSYDPAGRLVAVRDPLGAVVQYIYDGSNRMLSATDPRGNVYLKNSYDQQGRVISQSNARSFTTLFAYDTPVAGTTTITDPLGKVIKHVHDSALRLIAVVDPQGGATSYTYDLNNLKTSVTDPMGHAWHFAYDTSGNLTAATDPNNKTSSFQYDARNDLTQITDRLGATTNLTYDSAGNLLAIQDAVGNSSTFTYDAYGEALTATNARNAATGFAYDPAGDLAKITDALGGTVSLAYDAAGRLLSLTNQLGKTSTRTYDADNHLLSVSDPLGAVTQFGYDPNGNLTAITDANGKVTQYAYDPTNKLAQVKDAAGGITNYRYDANTNLTAVIDANGHTTSYAYDGLGRLASVTDPLGAQKAYAYDADGDLISLRDGNGKTNALAYDALNRLVSEALSDGKTVGYSYDATGNRLIMADWRGTTNYAYDALNRVTAVTTPDGKAVGYGYDVVGNRATLSYPDGNRVQYQYDDLNRLTAVMDWAGKSTSYGYDAAGNLTGVAFPNGASSAYGYDAANRLTNIVNRSGLSVLSSFTYALDKAGNRLQVANNYGSINRYGYDALYRLTSWTAPSGQVTQYVYDPVGNRTSLVSSAGTTKYSYNAADELLTAGTTTFSYDGNGNLISKATGSTSVNYGWDALNRLISVVGGGTNTQYQYDGDGNRVSQQVGSGIYQYLNDTATALPVVLNENGPNGIIDYQYGLSMIAAASSNFEYYYQFDGVGSAVSLTDPTGALKANYSYDPWGKMLNPLDPTAGKNKYKFTGEAVDPGTGLSFVRARYYDPTVGRFTKRDPLPSFLLTSKSLDSYIYALNNPVRFVDPSGLSAIDAQAGDQGSSTTQPPPPNNGAAKGVVSCILDALTGGCIAGFLESKVVSWIVNATAGSQQTASDIELLLEPSFFNPPSETVPAQLRLLNVEDRFLNAVGNLLSRVPHLPGL